MAFVWRLEHKSGEGPFHSSAVRETWRRLTGSFEEDYNKTDELADQSPYRGPTAYEEKLRWKQGWVHGALKEQFGKWFSPLILRELAADHPDLVVRKYRLRKDKVEKGEWQVIFDRAAAK